MTVLVQKGLPVRHSMTRCCCMCCCLTVLQAPQASSPTAKVGQEGHYEYRQSHDAYREGDYGPPGHEDYYGRHQDDYIARDRDDLPVGACHGICRLHMVSHDGPSFGRVLITRTCRMSGISIMYANEASTTVLVG